MITTDVLVIGTGNMARGIGKRLVAGGHLVAPRRLDVVEGAPSAGLPAAHVGIHTGPVIAQDGDVYGRTVNLAARIAAYAQAGQVVVSEETARLSDHHDLRFAPRGVVDLKGVAELLRR